MDRCSYYIIVNKVPINKSTDKAPSQVKIVDYLSITADQLHLYMAFVFSNGNEIFQDNIVSCQKARAALEGFEEHKDEFHLISWPPNSADLNLIELIWVF
ncbi:transposable element Tc1 transposase [Trichonephila clavipes]|nr:transposable element Tc1 transposase [Trichonephila clavipes]